uniref:Uncharacterized protein n=1 Tax=Cucumis melo TaxID=3656 RepID=A0A9I9ELZ8_CUCME
MPTCEFLSLIISFRSVFVFPPIPLSLQFDCSSFFFSLYSSIVDLSSFCVISFAVSFLRLKNPSPFPSSCPFIDIQEYLSYVFILCTL